MPKHPLRYRAGTFSIFPLMLVNFTNFLGIACTFLQHMNHCLGRFFPLGGSQLESLDRPFTYRRSSRTVERSITFKSNLLVESRELICCLSVYLVATCENDPRSLVSVVVSRRVRG